jgi:hypothetical protein
LLLLIIFFYFKGAGYIYDYKQEDVKIEIKNNEKISRLLHPFEKPENTSYNNILFFFLL